MYTVTIVGGGAISCGYDSPEDENILTHTHAALKHEQIKLDSIVEVDENRQQHIIDKWGEEFEVYSSLSDSINKYKSDIFIVATPTSMHLQTIEDILSTHSPKLVICEKPIVSSMDELDKLYNLIKKNKVKILTNFPRRFDPSLNTIKEKILHTKKYHFYGTFTKGLIHNGSHMIDLISMLIGNISSIDYINKEIIQNDFFGQFIVNTDSCDGFLLNIDTNKLAVFELTIYTDAAKIEIITSNKKLKIQYIDKSNLKHGFETYSIEEELPWTLNKSLYNTLTYAVKLIENDKLYEDFATKQYNINKLIFNTHENFLEDK